MTIITIHANVERATAADSIPIQRFCMGLFIAQFVTVQNKVVLARESPSFQQKRELEETEQHGFSHVWEWRNNSLRESHYRAVFEEIDSEIGGFFGQAGHAQDVSGEGNDKTRAGGDFDAPYSDDEVFWPSEELWIVGK